MKIKAETPSRLSREMLETAAEMHALGIMDDAGYAKITMRDFGTEIANVEPLTGDDIRALRAQAKMSQAVFARYPQHDGWACLEARTRRGAADGPRARFAQRHSKARDRSYTLNSTASGDQAR